MVQAARGIQREKEDKGEIERNKFRFEQGRGHELDEIIKQDESVDLVVAGQAAHWFDPLPTYRSLARILKPGGAFCFWVHFYQSPFFLPFLSMLISPMHDMNVGLRRDLFPLSTRIDGIDPSLLWWITR